jgi:hypothetical protein
MQLEEELRRYEQLTKDTDATAIHSHKQLVRAAQTLSEASRCHERIMQHVGVLSAAMTDTRARQQACAEQLVASGGQIGERATVFQTLLGQCDQLRELSKALNESAAQVAARQSEGAPDEAILVLMTELLERIGGAVTRADEVGRVAKEASFADVARDVDSLRQQMLSAKNRLTLAQRSLADRAPS